MDQWIAMTKVVGFPIMVTLYLLYRIEGKLDELNRSIQELATYSRDYQMIKYHKSSLTFKRVAKKFLY
ncbi:YvrJ family protein [Terrilactibacillus laevilacticus]|uniref:YvrJ family protein n=2 Tax=Terrilactibacillus laevilacticus TaxID=1380157 RepID=A0ABW5PRJ1_9BACI|nr:YvrJ family protein [Terrilactibacillus laevilacticus]